MGCEECGGSGSETVLVTYTTGETERMVLCKDCNREYAEGGLVSSISHDGK